MMKARASFAIFSSGNPLLDEKIIGYSLVATHQRCPNKTLRLIRNGLFGWEITDVVLERSRLIQAGLAEMPFDLLFTEADNPVWFDPTRKKIWSWCKSLWSWPVGQVTEKEHQNKNSMCVMGIRRTEKGVDMYKRGAAGYVLDCRYAMLHPGQLFVKAKDWGMEADSMMAMYGHL